MDIQKWLGSWEHGCACGRDHSAFPLQWLKIDAGILGELPDALRELNVKKPFVVMDERSREAAGNDVLRLLSDSGMPFGSVCLAGRPKVLPNEEYLAEIDAAYDDGCDFVLGVGSGVVNDLCKMAARSRGIGSGIAATAPSMDGYASNSSAMELCGVKTTVYTACPKLILCDTLIMREAPEEMLRAGFGDMAAKVISIADWRIAHLITGEYYCESIARMMLESCETVLSKAEGILAREEPAIKSMTEGLVLSGIAMTCAGVSRPASGMEHTISHLLEMFAIARGDQPALHGLQVGYGVRAALVLYERARTFLPTEESCRAACAAFDGTRWRDSMRRAFGSQAEELIAKAEDERRNSPENRMERGMRAVGHWAEIQKIISDVVRQGDALTEALNRMGIPQLWEPEKLGYSAEDAKNAVLHSKDLRNRYIFTSMCADIGLDYRMENGFHDLRK